MVCLIANRVIASLQCTLRETVPSHHDSQRAVLGKDPPFATGVATEGVLALSHGQTLALVL